MSSERIPFDQKIMLIHVPGVCHGPEQYARSPIHDRVAHLLFQAKIDCQTLFVPSTDVRFDNNTQKLTGLQLSPSKQLDRLHDAAEEAHRYSRVPIALAHSFGSIATMAALRDQSLPYAVFVSPTFLNPRVEIFESEKFSRRLQPIGSSDFMWMMSPSGISYSTFFPNDHFDDSLYCDTILSQPDRIEEVVALTKARARLFLGEHDWNYFCCQYSQLFPTTTVIPNEKHSFELAENGSNDIWFEKKKRLN